MGAVARHFLPGSVNRSFLYWWESDGVTKYQNPFATARGVVGDWNMFCLREHLPVRPGERTSELLKVSDDPLGNDPPKCPPPTAGISQPTESQGHGEYTEQLHLGSGTEWFGGRGRPCIGFEQCGEGH